MIITLHFVLCSLPPCLVCSLFCPPFCPSSSTPHLVLGKLACCTLLWCRRGQRRMISADKIKVTGTNCELVESVLLNCFEQGGPQILPKWSIMTQWWYIVDKNGQKWLKVAEPKKAHNGKRWQVKSSLTQALTPCFKRWFPPPPSLHHTKPGRNLHCTFLRILVFNFYFYYFSFNLILLLFIIYSCIIFLYYFILLLLYIIIYNNSKMAVRMPKEWENSAKQDTLGWCLVFLLSCLLRKT